MIKCLALIFLMAMTAASHLPGARQRLDDALIRVGLDSDAPAPSASPTPTTDNAATDNAAPNDAASCDGVTFTRNLKYGDHQLNVLDVATAQTAGAKRPVIVFVAGDSFSSDGKTSVASPL